MMIDLVTFLVAIGTLIIIHIPQPKESDVEKKVKVPSGKKRSTDLNTPLSVRA